MKIGDLGQHCGGCNVTEYCGNPFCYCLCTDSRFEDVEETKYKEIAEKAPIKPYGKCGNCELDCEAMGCDVEDESRDFRCHQTADFVEAQLAREEQSK